MIEQLSAEMHFTELAAHCIFFFIEIAVKNQVTVKKVDIGGHKDGLKYVTVGSL